MRTWLVPRAELTPDQLRAVELDAGEHRVVAGAPGSGKTLVLLHRAAYLRDRGKVTPDRFRIFVFTNVLRGYIASALPLLGIPGTAVTTFDKWCCDYYREHVSRRLPRTVADGEGLPDFAAIREAVLEGTRPQLWGGRPLEFAMVDEGQDLDGTCFGILRNVARHVTVCIDFKQQIYEDRADEGVLLERLGIRRRNVSILDAFRCCPFVAELAAEFIAGKEERSAYLRQVRTEQAERERPLLFVARSVEEERERLASVLRTRALRGERVGVLFPRRRMVHGYARDLAARGIEAEVYPNLDFGSDRPKVMPYHSAKGLTLDTVLLPRLVPEGFVRFSAEMTERLLFVGLTRATKWAYLSTVAAGDEVFEPLRRLLEPGAAGVCAVQRGAEPQPIYAPAAEEGDDDLTSLL